MIASNYRSQLFAPLIWPWNGRTARRIAQHRSAIWHVVRQPMTLPMMNYRPISKHWTSGQSRSDSHMKKLRRCVRIWSPTKPTPRSFGNMPHQRGFGKNSYEQVRPAAFRQGTHRPFKNGRVAAIILFEDLQSRIDRHGR